MSDSDYLDSERTLVTAQSAFAGAREFKPGDIVGGHYKIKSVIGRGGMGVVYCAEHLVIQQERALKALAPDRVNDDNWQRFQAEGRAIARLDHPNIVKVYDMGIDGSHSIYYVMDLLSGVALSEVIHKKNSPSVFELLDIFIQICDGLGYAHRQGLMHRDVKPSNIILCRDGAGKLNQVKIIDYGLVKLIGENNRMVQWQTATGQVCGSPLYMSPEQCIGGIVDERSDIYSLGCTLFEALTGIAPFVGDNALETVFMHQKETPPLISEVRPDRHYPGGLQQVVNRMLEKIPAQRHQSMEHVAQDLMRIKQGKPVSGTAVYGYENVTGNKGEAEIDDDKLTSKKQMPLALACGLGAGGCLILLATAFFACNYFTHQPVKHSLAVDAPSADSLIAPLTEAQISVRDIYAKSAHISNGVVIRNGSPVRVFNFPSVAIGLIYAGDNEHEARPAQGEILMPADQPITLSLPRPIGEGTRLFPEILTKIGPEDVCRLEVVEPQNSLDDTILLSDVSPKLVLALRSWTHLERLNFYHATLKTDTVMALNQLHPVKELLLRNARVEAADLIKVKWLDQVSRLDLKGFEDIDLVLKKLQHSTHLERLDFSDTTPSIEALKCLSTCPNLTSLAFTLSRAHLQGFTGPENISKTVGFDSPLTDEQLAIFCNLPRLQQLSVGSLDVTPRQVDILSKARSLKLLLVGSIGEAEFAEMKKRLPHCRIILQPKKSV